MNATIDEASRRARAAIFGRLRAAGPAAVPPVPDVATHFRVRLANADAAGLAATFAERARGWRAEVVETGPDDWADAVAEVVRAKGLRRVLAGRDTALSAGLAARIDAARLAWYDAPIERCREMLFDGVDAGITTTRGGIVETGTLIVWPDRHEPRTLSLVPPVHIAVLRASTLFADLFAAMDAQRWAGSLPTNALLVTGPSKTADIQRLLVYGAHGPKELIIVLIRDEVSP
ncbi:MAG TPA: lactate utilization protein C [Dokdonella sp.]|uniref:LutC/YkgG family protein n=1 Tax=Dokdonella sp. TaxID=2291710 RepID=UPI002C6A47DB|nr:lactate utilization protein C [Dokdonella sp.]HUD42199.1 lactate utilization protein C [Dokdonella sp.]